MKKYYDDPKYNAAFDHCVDVMARLMLKYGAAVLEKREAEDGRLMELAGNDQNWATVRKPLSGQMKGRRHK